MHQIGSSEIIPRKQKSNQFFKSNELRHPGDQPGSTSFIQLKTNDQSQYDIGGEPEIIEFDKIQPMKEMYKPLKNTRSVAKLGKSQINK